MNFRNACYNYWVTSNPLARISISPYPENVKNISSLFGEYFPHPKKERSIWK
nr:MAG TPA: hypothetical protein [Caudoviricetes sp.]